MARSGRPGTRGIRRRDIIHGLGALGAGAWVPGRALADTVLAMETSAYPPALTGLRGNHAGSYEVAHALAREGRRDWGAPASIDERYDLVVVGAGISGLAAAWFYRQQHPGARVLLLDNHDDFGGHAKRNEFMIGGRRLIGYGGSQSMEAPGGYPRLVKALLGELGVEPGQFDRAYDANFYRRHGLTAGVFFNQAFWGSDRLVKYDLGGLSDYLPLAPSSLDAGDAVAQMPISPAARAQLLRVLTTAEDQIPEVPAEQKEDYLYSMTYLTFIARHLGVTEPEVVAVLQDLASDSGVGIETAMAGDAILYSSLPGYDAAGLPPWEDGELYIHHYPDGNATIARALVQRMIPSAAAVDSIEALVSSEFDYSKLDSPSSPVRLRLNSTVVNVANRGGDNPGASITYVKNGKAHQVRADSCILACYHAMIPALCPGLPADQREALSMQVKSPILYTNVALKNWRAWAELGIGAVVAPGSYHVNAMLDFPVSVGNYRFSNDPDQPIVVHMERFPYPPYSNMDKRDQFRWGRHQLLSTPFKDIEESVISQLSGILGAGGFKAERDIAAITVNRWAHGYSYYYDFLKEPWYEDWDDPRYPHVRARQPMGRIAIANCDAAASAMLEAAVSQAHRAVQELG